MRGIDDLLKWIEEIFPEFRGTLFISNIQIALRSPFRYYLQTQVAHDEQIVA
jgi:hypothetical protein